MFNKEDGKTVLPYVFGSASNPSELPNVTLDTLLKLPLPNVPFNPIKDVLFVPY